VDKIKKEDEINHIIIIIVVNFSCFAVPYHSISVYKKCIFSMLIFGGG
jgi:hypothetical protein